MRVTSYSHIVHYQFTVSHNTRSYIATTSPDSSTRSTKADQLTVDLARRAHQSPGPPVDEDGLRGLPLAQRTGQGQSGVVAFLVWELVRPPGTASPSTERGRLASCPSSPSLVSSSLFADKTVRADGVTHRSIGTFG